MTGAQFNLVYEDGIQIAFTFTNRHGSTSTRSLTVWPEQVLVNAVVRVLRDEHLSEQSVACAVYDKHHHWFHHGGEGEKPAANDAQDLELDLSATVKEAGLKEGHILAAKYGERKVELISTEDIAGCWCCVCAPCM